MLDVIEKERKKQDRIVRSTVTFIAVIGLIGATIRPEVLLPILFIATMGILVLLTAVAYVRS